MTKISTTSRRALLAGAAALPALAAPIAAVASAVPDPIFAAIERHRAAFIRMHQAGAIRGSTVDCRWSPEYDAEALAVAEAAEYEADTAFDDASRELLALAAPASAAGLVALLDYAEAFNRGAVVHDPEYGCSIPFHWPIVDEFEFEDDDHHGGASFAWALLTSIRENLAGKAVQS